jgi:hypothetical protein
MSTYPAGPTRRSPETMRAYAEGYAAATMQAVKEIQRTAETLTAYAQTVLEVAAREQEEQS